MTVPPRASAAVAVPGVQEAGPDLRGRGLKAGETARGGHGATEGGRRRAERLALDAKAI